MIHTSRFDGTRCGGKLFPHEARLIVTDEPWMVRCEECGQVGVPYIAEKTRSRPGESLADPARAASVLSLDELPQSIQVSNRSHKVIRR